MKSKYTGALPSQHLFSLIGDHFIVADRSNIKPASLDLTIGDEIYEIEGTFQVQQGSSVYSVLQQIKKKKLLPHHPLRKNRYYIVKINEVFNFPSSVYGYANPKSTTGRLDIHARLLADGVPQYDAISSGFRGDCWILIKPQSFSILLKPGTSLNQMRLFYSDRRLNKFALEAMMQREGLLFTPQGERMFYKDMQIQDSPDSIVLCLDVKKGDKGEPIGYRAKNTAEVIEYDKKYKAGDFFEAIETDQNGRILLCKDSFSILSSIEHVSVPQSLACEMASIDDRFGEFRSHYAGFIDPGWGWLPNGSATGRPLTLEVRTFEKMYAYHGQPIARIKFEELADVPEINYDSIPSNYTKQSKAKLAKQFM